MHYAEPAALDLIPTIPGETTLTGWEDVSEPALVGIRTLRQDAAGVVAVLIRRSALWDAVAVRGSQVRHAVLLPEEVAEWLASLTR